jgi:hypothetical protein
MANEDAKKTFALLWGFRTNGKEWWLRASHPKYLDFENYICGGPCGVHLVHPNINDVYRFIEFVNGK